jgi:hypothetical protein
MSESDVIALQLGSDGPVLWDTSDGLVWCNQGGDPIDSKSVDLVIHHVEELLRLSQPMIPQARPSPPCTPTRSHQSGAKRKSETARQEESQESRGSSAAANPYAAGSSKDRSDATDVKAYNRSSELDLLAYRFRRLAVNAGSDDTSPLDDLKASTLKTAGVRIAIDPSLSGEKGVTDASHIVSNQILKDVYPLIVERSGKWTVKEAQWAFDCVAKDPDNLPLRCTTGNRSLDKVLDNNIADALTEVATSGHTELHVEHKERLELQIERLAFWATGCAQLGHVHKFFVTALPRIRWVARTPPPKNVVKSLKKVAENPLCNLDGSPSGGSGKGRGKGSRK